MPDVEATGALGQGNVFVVEQEGSNLVQAVETGKQVVLEAGGKKLDLTTTTPAGAYGGAGTYVSESDAAGIAGKPAKLRLFRKCRDRARKSLSVPGLLAWGLALVGLALAVFGLIFLNAKPPVGRAEVADAAKRVQMWVVDPPADAPASATARVAIANECLDGLAGRSAPADTKIPGVQCKPPDPSWLHDKDNAAKVTALGGLLTALLGAFGAWRKIGFGSSP